MQRRPTGSITLHYKRHSDSSSIYNIHPSFHRFYSLLFCQICSVQMSASHQIFPSPLKNQQPIHFLTSRRNQGVRQERLYATASSSAALSPRFSGILGWIPSHPSDSLLFILSLCSKTITNTHLNSACIEVNVFFNTYAKKTRVRSIFFSVQNFAYFPYFVLTHFVKISHTLLITRKFKVELGAKHITF